jgi:hypothetical protein
MDQSVLKALKKKYSHKLLTSVLEKTDGRGDTLTVFKKEY